VEPEVSEAEPYLYSLYQ